MGFSQHALQATFLLIRKKIRRLYCVSSGQTYVILCVQHASETVNMGGTKLLLIACRMACHVTF